MKFILLVTIVIGISLNGYAQTDFGSPSFAIPRQNEDFNTATPLTSNKFNVPKFNIPPMSFLPLKSPSVNSNTLPSRLKKIGEMSIVNFMQKKEFKNPGDIYEAKLNKKEGAEGMQVFRKNQYLGDFKTKSTFIKISCRDHEFVDGDEVRVYINDLLIQSGIVLDEDFKEFEITLKSGFNKIDFEAINQGSSGPNTAEFRVYDDKGILISANQWNLATGFKATVIVIKE